MAAQRQAPLDRSLALKYATRLVGSLLIAGLFAWLLQRGELPLMPSGAHPFAELHWGLVLLAWCCWVSGYFVRAARWYFLLAPVKPVPLTVVVRVAFVGFGAVVALPFRLGEVVRPLLMQRAGKVSFWAATGTVGAERVCDGVALSACLFAGLSLTEVSSLTGQVGELPVQVSLVAHAARAAVLVFVAAFAAMSLFYWRRALARKLFERSLGWAAPKLSTKLADKLELVANGLGFLSRARAALPFAALTALYWLATAASTFFLARGSGLESLTFNQAVVVMGVLALGILVPNAPGYFGAFQFSVYAALSLYLPSALVNGPGSVFVFMLFVMQMGFAVFAGGVALLFEPTRIGELLTKDARQDSPTAVD